jgi:hypothetical protein
MSLPCYSCGSKEECHNKILVAKLITTEGWQQQYREVKSAADVLPTAADIQKKVAEGCIDTSLAIPPAGPSQRVGPRGVPRVRCNLSKECVGLQVHAFPCMFTIVVRSGRQDREQ